MCIIEDLYRKSSNGDSINIIINAAGILVRAYNRQDHDHAIEVLSRHLSRVQMGEAIEKAGREVERAKLMSEAERPGVQKSPYDNSL